MQDEVSFAEEDVLLCVLNVTPSVLRNITAITGKTDALTIEVTKIIIRV
jgi:hypothetical protein